MRATDEFDAIAQQRSPAAPIRLGHREPLLADLARGSERLAPPLSINSATLLRQLHDEAGAVVVDGASAFPSANGSLKFLLSFCCSDECGDHVPLSRPAPPLASSLRHSIRHSELAAEHVRSAEPATEAAAASLSGDVRDDLLRMLFVCCDDAIPIESQLVLSLKTLCGFDVGEIAER